MTSAKGGTEATNADPGETATTPRRRGRLGGGRAVAPRPSARPSGARVGLAPRLFAAMALVVLAGAGTLLLVALLVAPQVFTAHLRTPGVPPIPLALQAHLDQAFDQAVLLALAVGVGAAVAAAALVTWLVSRRLAAPVQDLADAATRLAHGHYDTAVPDPRLGPEFATLTAAVNQLAGRLQDAESTRRRLLGDLTHQLRTPLASLEATVEAVTDQVLPVDQTTLATLAEQTARLRHLVTDLEAVSRAEERQLVIHPRPVRLHEIADRATAVLRPRYDAKGVTLSRHDRDERAVVDADADRLVEAVMNLLDNALRHTPPGGHVTIAVKADRVFTARPVQLTITDTGTGFDPDLAERLFERFYRAPTLPGTEPAPGRDPVLDTGPRGGRHGSGIGLTIARAIVQAHDATLTATSAGPGHGATFTIALPRSPHPATGSSRTHISRSATTP